MKKIRFSTVLAFLLVILLLTACGGSEAPAAEAAPEAQEAAPETNAPAEAAPTEDAAPAEEEPAPLTADQITYEDVLDDTDLLDGETVALHATSDLVVMPSLVCYDMFGIPEAVQQKAAITEDVHMLGMTIDNKTDKLLFPVACPGSLKLNGQSIADERFALATINTIFDVFVTAEENVDPGDSSQMVFFLLAGEELLPELTGLDHVETVEFSFDLLDEAGSVVDTVDVNFAASRPLTEEELAAKNAEYAPIAPAAPAAVMTSEDLNGLAEIEPVVHIYRTELYFGDDEEGTPVWVLADINIHNVSGNTIAFGSRKLIVNGIEINRNGLPSGFNVEPGETEAFPLMVSLDTYESLGISTEDDIHSMVTKVEIYEFDPDGSIQETPAVSIEDYTIR